MDCETFALRKKILEEFYKDRVDFNGYKYFYIETCTCPEYNQLLIFSSIEFYGYYGFNIKKFYSILKPLIYYLYSITYKRKFIRENFLLTDAIVVENYFRFRDCLPNNKIDFYERLDFEPDKDFLKNYDDEELNIINAIEEDKSDLYMFNLKIQLTTSYKFDNEVDYILSLTELEENGELVNELLINRLNRRSTESDSDNEFRYSDSDNDEDSNDENIINSSQTFKSDE